MNALADPRDDSRCLYSQSHLIWTGILLFLMQLESRRQLRRERLRDVFVDNLGKLSGQRDIPYIADPDTLAYYAENVSVGQIDKLLAGITGDLVRSKALDRFRISGYLPVAIDGSQICTFDREPWPDCPHRRVAEDRTQYFAYVLDAKLVTPCGMALTMATEQLTNEGHKQFEKQDCELKAFPRIVAKLHQYFPRTPICLLLDGLYANQNTIRMIEKLGWKYIITFKEGSMPERYAEARELVELQRQNRRDGTYRKREQLFEWAEGLPIAEFETDVIFCHETDADGACTNFAWITNFTIKRSNVERIANEGGRLRWKIENEGFNVQKNHGYGMKHPYSEHANGFKVFYRLLLMAHYIAQLILHGNLIRSLSKTFETAENFARRLAESMRNFILPDNLSLPGQIRFQPP